MKKLCAQSAVSGYYSNNTLYYTCGNINLTKHLIKIKLHLQRQ